MTDVEKLTGIFALAGGTTSDADLDNVYIIRNDKEIELDAQSLIESGSTMSDIGLQSGDQNFCPQNLVGKCKKCYLNNFCGFGTYYSRIFCAESILINKRIKTTMMNNKELKENHKEKSLNRDLSNNK